MYVQLFIVAPLTFWLWVLQELFPVLVHSSKINLIWQKTIRETSILLPQDSLYSYWCLVLCSIYNVSLFPDVGRLCFTWLNPLVIQSWSPYWHSCYLKLGKKRNVCCDLVSFYWDFSFLAPTSRTVSPVLSSGLAIVNCIWYSQNRCSCHKVAVCNTSEMVGTHQYIIQYSGHRLPYA